MTETEIGHGIIQNSNSPSEVQRTLGKRRSGKTVSLREECCESLFPRCDMTVANRKMQPAAMTTTQDVNQKERESEGGREGGKTQK